MRCWLLLLRDVSGEFLIAIACLQLGSVSRKVLIALTISHLLDRMFALLRSLLDSLLLYFGCYWRQYILAHTVYKSWRRSSHGEHIDKRGGNRLPQQSTLGLAETTTIRIIHFFLTHLVLKHLLELPPGFGIDHLHRSNIFPKRDSTSGLANQLPSSQNRRLSFLLEVFGVLFFLRLVRLLLDVVFVHLVLFISAYLHLLLVAQLLICKILGLLLVSIHGPRLFKMLVLKLLVHGLLTVLRWFRIYSEGRIGAG